MILQPVWEILEEEVFPVSSTGLLFNQYSDNVPLVDLPEGNLVRRQNLHLYLESFRKKPDILIIGEAAGPRGSRFSGIPFTGEAALSRGQLPFAGKQSSASAKPLSEASGTILWQSLKDYYPRFMLWNAVPLHPHSEDRPLSVRTPSQTEVKLFKQALDRVIAAILPGTLIALGRTAENILRDLGISCDYVRHPSQAGAGTFRKEIKRFFAD